MESFIDAAGWIMFDMNRIKTWEKVVIIVKVVVVITAVTSD